MIICKLQGGLGNQMFQWAFAKKISNRTGRKILFDTTQLDDHTEIKGHTTRDLDLSVFNIELDLVKGGKSKWEQGKKFNFLKEPRYTDHIEHRRFFTNLEYLQDLAHFGNLHNPIYLDGHWQKARLINGMEYYFEFKDKSKSALHKEIENSQISCCINIRRGDYLTNYKDFFHQLTIKNYFAPAIEYMEKITKGNIHFYIFSDDIEWCKENICILDANGKRKFTIVEHTEKGKKFSKYLEMMSCCKSFIIPNSSFAYMAAFLKRDKDKIVIAPKNWFKDPKINDYGLIPEKWIKM
jgi:hypothetical protein